MSPDASVALQLIVRGRVQGVGYRYAMVDIAGDAGVQGWVRNRGDGTVEAFVQGRAEAVERIVAWARRGPAGAHVSAVEIALAEFDTAAKGFAIRGSEP